MHLIEQTRTQTRVQEPTDTDTYRLAVFNRAGTAVLLESQDSGRTLPCVRISKFTRPAQEITALLRRRWQIPSILLFSGSLEETQESAFFAALESQTQAALPPAGLDWFPVHYAISHLLSKQEGRILESTHSRAAKSTMGTDPEPFSRLGWLGNLEAWIGTVIRPLDAMRLRGFEQLNGCETFSLIRFETTHRPLWFKAVGEPNLHEFPITMALARLFPAFVPSVLASQPEVHGWLMTDSAGATLNEMADPSAWHKAVEALAGIQIASTNRLNELLEAGCPDLRITTLLELLDPFLEVMADLMKQQTKVPPVILSERDFSELSVMIKDALQCLDTLEIPPTLGHSDFNPANIIVGRERCTFLDWAEAHVSHPFLTFEFLLAHLRKDFQQLASVEKDLRATYSGAWSAVASPGQIAEAYLFSPLVAVYAYAVSAQIWRNPERLKIPGFPGYLRCLTRRMKQEADSLLRRRFECLN